MASVAGSAQNKKWVLGSPLTNAAGTTNTATAGSLRFYDADFTGPAPVFTQRVLGASVNAISSGGINETLNSATDTAGNIAFYVFANSTVPFSGSTSDKMYFIAYDAMTTKDEVFATVLPSGTGASSAKDLNIVRREGTADQYYVIYKTSCTNQFSPDEIRYVTVDMSTKTLSAPVTLQSSSLNEGMAVSVRNCVLDNRWFFSVKYVGGNYDIYRSSITSAGMSAPVLVYTILIPGNVSLGQGDIEISPTSDKIAFVNYTTGSVTKDVIIFDFNLATGAISNERWINNTSNYIIEVEFSPDGQRLYAFRGGTSAITPALYNIAVPAAGVNYTITGADQLPVVFTTGHTLEVAYDGNLYFAPQVYNTTLRYISNPNANAASNIIGTTAASSFGAGNAVSFVLPEQIDGYEPPVTPLNMNVTGVGLICSGQSVTLSATGAASYAWSGGSTDTTAATTVSPATTTTYYVTGTSSCGSDTDTITVQVDLPVNISVTASDDTICAGQTATLSATGSATYQWSSSASAGASISVNPAASTAYYVSGTANACVADTDTITVYVENLPSVSVAGIDSICAGSSTTLTAIGGPNYTWSGGSTATTASITVAPAGSTAYYVSSTNGCGSDADTITVRVDLPISISAAATDDSICSGQPVTLSATGSTTYQWSNSASTASSITINPTTDTTYYVSGGANACPADTDTLTIYVEAIPSINVTGATAVCTGQSTTLAASGGSNYTWSGGSTGTTDSITVSPTVTTDYYVTSSSLHCGSDTDTVTVTVDTVSIISIAGTDTICAGQSSTLTASGGDTYTWSTAQTTPTITVTPGATTTYTVTGSNGSCAAATTTFDVIVNPVPIATITGANYICAGAGGVYTTTASGGSSPYQYAWSTGNNTATISIMPTVPTTNLNVTVTDAEGCSSTSSLTVTTVPVPTAIATASGSGCAPLSVNFFSEATNATTFEWSFGDGTTSNQQNPSHLFFNGGIYTVMLITTNIAGCADTLVLDSAVTAYTTPIASIASTGDVNTDHTLLTVYNHAQNADNCTLDYGDGTSLQGCNWSDAFHTYEQEGNYAVTQIVTTENGCADTAVLYINATYESTFFAPNAITANSNAHNDIFYIYGTGLFAFHLTIYNRWGEMIYESRDQYQGWDGTSKGRPVEEGVYVWKVDYRTKRLGDEQKIGHVTVIR